MHGGKQRRQHKDYKIIVKKLRKYAVIFQHMSQIRTGIAKRFRAKREFQRFGFKHIETV